MRRTLCIALALVTLLCAPTTFAGGFAEFELSQGALKMPGEIGGWLSDFVLGVWDKIGGHFDPFGDESAPEPDPTPTSSSLTEPEETELLISPATSD